MTVIFVLAVVFNFVLFLFFSLCYLIISSLWNLIRYGFYFLPLWEEHYFFIRVN
jgi:hypothetical protein